MKTGSALLRIVLVACLVLALAGCTGPKDSSESSGNAAGTDEAVSQEAQGDAATSGSGGWMDGIPGSVPQFTFGEFDKEQSSSMQAGDQTIYSLYYEGVERADVESYLDELEAAGFEVQNDSVTDGVSAAGQLKNGDAIIIGFSVSWQSNGHVDYTINVLPGA